MDNIEFIIKQRTLKTTEEGFQFEIKISLLDRNWGYKTRYYLKLHIIPKCNLIRILKCRNLLTNEP